LKLQPIGFGPHELEREPTAQHIPGADPAVIRQGTGFEHSRLIMRQVYVPFSITTRCALTDWHTIPAFHACAFAPPFTDDAKLVVYTREDFDRWKGLLTAAAKRALILAARWLEERAAAVVPQRA
jgi:hypothetical protein